KDGDLRGAEEAFRRADEAGHPTAAAYCGVFDEAHGEIADAEQSYRRADERGDGFGAFRLGLLLSQTGDWDGAREAWARADEGGLRIGLVSEMHPVELSNGQVGAQLTLQLSESNGQIPVDSTATIRPRSVLGLKYLNIARGKSTKMFTDGGTMPLSQTTVPVQFDDIN